MFIGTASAVLAGFGLAASALTYGGLRFVQVLCMAPVFPIVVARIAQHASGEAIGFVNSARIAAAFLGPVLATTMLTRTSASVVYLTLAALTLSCVAFVGVGRRSAAGAHC